MGATVEQRQGLNKFEKWYQSKLLGSSANSSKEFGGGERLKASDLR
jgi:hypothetical protein